MKIKALIREIPFVTPAIKQNTKGDYECDMGLCSRRSVITSSVIVLLSFLWFRDPKKPLGREGTLKLIFGAIFLLPCARNLEINLARYKIQKKREEAKS